MQKEVFSGSALVEIQGDFVLRFLERKPAYVEYRILGLDETILIHDYRQIGIQAIDDVMASNDVTHFPSLFSGPAFVTIYDSNNMDQPILIVLQETFDPRPDHTLYIAIGIPDGIPIYRYIFGRVQQIDDQHFALVGLFQPQDDFVAESVPSAFCTD